MPLLLSLILLATPAFASEDHDHAGEHAHASEDTGGHDHTAKPVHTDEHTGDHGHDDHDHDHEGLVTLTPEQATRGGVASVVAGPRDLERSLQITGRIGIPSDRLAEIHPRFAGIVREASGTIGDRISRGQVLATLENNSTLARFSLVSPLDGVLLDRRAVVGGSAGEDDALYVVADLSEVWADLDVYGEDTHVVHVGETVTIRDDAHRHEAAATTTRISYVSPLRDVHTQTTLARAVLPNTEGHWAPGAFVTATIALAEPAAKIAVPPSALQSIEGRTSVFVRSGKSWQATPVTVGRSGDAWVEILAGVDAGSEVAIGNSFLLRAEIEKAGAEHEH